MKSDLELTQEVLARLELEPKIDLAGLRISVTDGVVTLRGSVDSEAERFSTRRAVQEIDGVRGLVDDDFEVLSARRLRPTDAELLARAQEAIQWLTAIPQDGIQLRANDGWLILEGAVETKHQSRSLEDVLREVRGVRGVRNFLRVWSGQAA